MQVSQRLLSLAVSALHPLLFVDALIISLMPLGLSTLAPLSTLSHTLTLPDAARSSVMNSDPDAPTASDSTSSASGVPSPASASREGR